MSNSPYKLHETTPDALRAMRDHSSVYIANVLDVDVVVLPNVWSPLYDWSSKMAVQNLPDVRGRTFLEVGSGTGVISVFAALKGAAAITAVDINPVAVANTNANLAAVGYIEANTFISDGFAAIDGKFDVIVWNAPYHGAPPKDILERGCTDDNYQDIRAFLKAAPKYLEQNGILVFGFSESGDLPLIRELLTESGLRFDKELSETAEGYNCMLFFMRHT